MKAITITLSYAFNYGEWLQMYALQHFLRQNKIETEILSYYPVWSNTSLPIRSLKTLILAILSRKREHGFQKDSASYLDMTAPCHCVEEVTAREQPDVYIAGSDQIWNPNITHGYDDVFYLHFPTTAHKMFYGASIGLDDINEVIVQEMKARIDPNAVISVREQSLCQALLDHTDLQVTCVLDPVFLLNPADYQQIMVPSPHKKYLLIYMMTDNDLCYQVAKRVAKEKNLTVIQVGKIRKRDGVDRTYATLSPTQFLGMVYGADYVVTNSFHGTALSILFRKQFTTIKVRSVQSRITSLLDAMELSQVCIEDIGDFKSEKIDYAAREPVISSAIQASRDFLLRSLEELEKK